MNRISSIGLPATDASAPGPESPKRHFDTAETQFFKQGEDDATSASSDVERFDDLEDGGKRRRFAFSRQVVIAVVAGSACLAVIGCVALWRSGSHPNSSAPATQEYAAISPTPSKPTPTSAGSAVAVASSAAPAAATPSPAAVPAAAEQPQAIPSAAGPPAAAQEAPAPAVAVAEPHPAALAAPADLPAKPALAAQEPTAPKPTAAGAGAASDAAAARARCKEVASSRRQKDLLSACSDAFAADPTAADIAVILAKTEFDRGRSAQALAWSQKALAADPNAADAYVFIGGVEQGAGHNKAAREAYRRYLQLAPGGRYAGDLRAIVGSL